MYLAIDIGGTKTLLASYDDNGTIVMESRFQTPVDYNTFLVSLGNAASDFQNTTFQSGAVGVRGNVDRINGLLIRDSVLQWRDAPLSRDFSEMFGCPFVIENDSKCAGLAEAVKVDGFQAKKVVYVTVSTGIGSALVINGMLDEHTIDSEVGKWIFEHGGIKQTWENFASGSAIVEQFGVQAKDIRDVSVWQQVCDNLALGIINICAAYTPDHIILGGGVGSHFNSFQPHLMDSLEKLHLLTANAVSMPEITAAKHPEEAVIYGCYELAKQIV